MPSKPREQSASGFYHVFQRGICLFDIFEDDEDRDFYINRLYKYCSDFGVEIHAWCLMSNHTHLLLRSSLEALSAMMRQLGSVYARHFNFRHTRSGPLFEGRFCSVCVESDVQFMNVIRYIHRNPIHHEETTLCGEYRWSSYQEYVGEKPSSCKTDFAISLFGKLDEFVRFHANRDNEHVRYLDTGTAGPMGDDEARRRANDALAVSGFKVAVSHIGTLAKEIRDKAILCVKQTVNCSIRQIQRLTAIAYSAIRSALALGRKSLDQDCSATPESAREEFAMAFEGPNLCLRACDDKSRRPAKVLNRPSLPMAPEGETATIDKAISSEIACESNPDTSQPPFHLARELCMRVPQPSMSNPQTRPSPKVAPNVQRQS